MLQIIISPAKQMQVEEAIPVKGIPSFPEKTNRLYEALIALEKTDGKTALKTLWKVSDKLLEQCLDLLHEFIPITSEKMLEDASISPHVSAALFTYKGIQFQSMAPQVMDAESLSWLQNHLWILSGLYGCVRPFQAVEPYRLEMGAPLSVDGTINLYEFWGDMLAQEIQKDCSGVINLASVEYAKSVLPSLDSTTPCVTCLFAETLKNGRPIQRATASKIARGSMVRWMAENRVNCFEDLKAFDLGYKYRPELSQDTNLVFLRTE